MPWPKGKKRTGTPYNKGNGVTLAWLKARVAYDGDGCLIWPFSTNGTGYGALGVDGKMRYAHRVMCELVKGPPPTPSHEVAHSCGRGRDSCVDPRHVSWKTRSENQLDRRRHGTAVTSRCGNRGKLTQEQRQEIRSLKGIETQRVLADRYGVHFETISRIQRTPVRVRKIKQPFTRSEVIEIRRIGRSKTLKELSSLFNAEISAIARVRSGKSYKDI